MAETTAMSVSLPSALVEDIVKAEIVRHLGKREELVGAILGHVIDTPCKCDRHRYSGPKQSVIACELERQIEKTCKEIVSAWVTENREAFAAELRKRLARPQEIKALAGSFLGGIQAGSWNVHVELKQAKDQ